MSKRLIHTNEMWRQHHKNNPFKDLYRIATPNATYKRPPWIFIFIIGGTNYNSFKSVRSELMKLFYLICFGTNITYSSKMLRNSWDCSTEYDSEQLWVHHSICFETVKTASPNVLRNRDDCFTYIQAKLIRLHHLVSKGTNMTAPVHM